MEERYERILPLIGWEEKSCKAKVDLSDRYFMTESVPKAPHKAVSVGSYWVHINVVNDC